MNYINKQIFIAIKNTDIDRIKEIFSNLEISTINLNSIIDENGDNIWGALNRVYSFLEAEGHPLSKIEKIRKFFLDLVNVNSNPIAIEFPDESDHKLISNKSNSQTTNHNFKHVENKSTPAKNTQLFGNPAEGLFSHTSWVIDDDTSSTDEEYLAPPRSQSSEFHKNFFNV